MANTTAATCPNCHQPVEPGASYCANCGYKLVQTAVPDTEASPVAVPVDIAAPAGAVAAVLPGATDGSSKAVIGLVLGVVTLIAWLLPIAGIITGVLAIVFASQAIHSRRRGLAIAGMILAGIGLLLSLGAWVHNVQELQKKTSSITSPQTQSDTAAVTQAISSPCYNTRIPTGFTLTQVAGNCTFSATNSTSGEEYDVKVIQAPNVTEGNLPAAAHQDAQQTVNAIAGGSISHESSGEFAGRTAYIVDVATTDGGSGRIAYIYGTTAQGNVTIVIHVQSASGASTSLSTIENNWNWL